MGLRLATALGACLLAVILAWVVLGNDDAASPTVAPSASGVETGEATAPELQASNATETADAAETGPARQQAPRSGSREPAAAPGEVQTGTLAVLVRNESSSQPVRGVRLTLTPVSAASSSPRSIKGSKAVLGENPRTDADGRAEFLVPLGEDCVLAGYPTDASVTSATRKVPALTTTDAVEVLLELPSRYDLRFVGRVVAAESGAPLTDARMTVQPSGYRFGGPGRPEPERLAESGVDASGTFEVLVPSWNSSHAKVEAPGRSQVLVKVTRGHEARARALEIRLARSATLDVLALGEDERPLEGVEVRLSTPSYEVDQAEGFAASLILGDVTWQGVTDEQGRCTLEGLAPQAHLALEYHLAAGVVRREATALVLEPGERREVAFRLGAGGSITGRLVGLDGAPVPDAEVWLLTDDANRPRPLRRHERDEARVQGSDGQGRFVFGDLADGYWLVGPSPLGPYAPLAEVVRVVDGVADRELILAAHSGLFIRGTVVDVSGAPVPRVHVMGQHDGRVVVTPDRPSDARGRFELGPLVEGTYRISAIFAPAGLSPGEPIEVQAGAQDVRLQLLPGASLSGVLLDAATDAPLEGDVLLSVATPGGRSVTGGLRHGRTERDGRFKFDGIRPDTYDIAAAGTSGLVALVRGVEVQAGVEGPELTLSAQPGAKVAVRYEGDEPNAGYTVFADDTAVASDGLRSGSEAVHAVPAGPIRVECRWKGLDAPRIRELTLQVGERGEAAFGRHE